MTFVYTLIFVITTVKFAMLLLMLIPLGGDFLFRYCNFLQNMRIKFKIYLYISYSLLVIFFIDSLNNAQNSQYPSESTRSLAMAIDPYSYCKIFYAQRNVYLTMISLILGFMLYRLPQLICPMKPTESKKEITPEFASDIKKYVKSDAKSN
jgi:hypothetical protein